MIWARLKTMKCPKCNKDITKQSAKAKAKFVYMCEGLVKGGCDFQITQERFNSLLDSMYKSKQRRVPQYGENDEALNNL